MRTDLLALAACVLLPLASPEGEAIAQPRADIQAANMGPLVQPFGLPRLTQFPDTSPQGRAGIGLDWASHAVTDISGAAFVRFDGETRRYSLTATGALPATGAWWALELPYVSHSGGSLDPVIDAWHDLLGLPEGDRPSRPTNELLYRVVDESGREILHYTRSASGPGDAAVSAGLPLTEGTGAAIRVEAPTGDPDRLLGSGGWDVAGWLAWEGQSGGWLGHLAGGALYMTGSELLSAQHRNWTYFGRAAIARRLLGSLTARAQLDGHGPLYDSPLVPLGEEAVELRFEGIWETAGGYRFSAGFSEDLVVGAAPDVTFHLGLSRSWE